MRRPLRTMLLTCVAVLAAGCSSEDSPSVAEAGARGATSTGEPAASPSRTSGPTSPQGRSTTIPYDLATLTSGCDEYVPLAAFMGEPEMQALWRSLAQDPDVLVVWCAEIANSDPTRLVAMVDGLQRLRQELAEHATTSPSPVPPTPALPPVERGVMPDVVCLTLRDAEQLLARAGEFSATALDLAGGEGPDDADPDPRSLVVTQSPRADTTIGDAEVRLGVLAPGKPSGC